MNSKEPTDKKIAQIEAILKDDIYWTVKYGPGWDPHIGAKKNGVWHSASVQPSCGVCAIGSYCVRRQPTPSPSTRNKYKRAEQKDVFITAQKLRVGYNWLNHVYAGVSHLDGIDMEEVPKAFELAKRLIKYGDEISDQEDELRHEAAQELQEWAANKYVEAL